MASLVARGGCSRIFPRGSDRSVRGRRVLYQQHATLYSQQVAQVYQSLYPGERSVMSPRRQMEGKIRNAGLGQVRRIS